MAFLVRHGSNAWFPVIAYKHAATLKKNKKHGTLEVRASLRKKVIIAYTTSKDSGEPARPRSLARTIGVCTLIKTIGQGEISAKEPKF